MDDAANKLPPSNDRCSVYNAECDELFLPVWKDDVRAWFDSGNLQDEVPVKATVDNLFDLLWHQDH